LDKSILYIFFSALVSVFIGLTQQTLIEKNFLVGVYFFLGFVNAFRFDD
jgi:hypothetical protein